MNALEDLARVLAAALEADEHPPCTYPDKAPLWLSEAHEERAEAAEECQACPILDPCRAAGRFERFGTWGGRDTGAKKARQEARA